MGLLQSIFAAKAPYGTPPFNPDGFPQTGGASPSPRGIAGFLDRFANPGSAIGQMGQALVAGSGGSLGDAAAYLMKAQQVRDLQKRKGPHFEHIGDSYGIVDDNTGQFTPTYTAPHQDDEITRLMKAAGVDPNSPEGQQGYRQAYENRIDPLANVQLGNGSFANVPRSQIGSLPGMAPIMGGVASPSAPIEPPPASLSPAGGVPGRLAPLAARVAQVESGNRDFLSNGNPVTSRTGARYAMQVMPATAHDPGFGVRPASSDTPEEFNRVGRDYLAAMQRRYPGDTSKALAAYNGGPGRVDDALSAGSNWLSTMPSETQSYVGKLSAPTKIASKAEYDALPSGAMFIAPDGTRRRKP
jgi:hypothetical protein